MNKTIRVLKRAAVVHMLNALVVAVIGFAGWQYVRLWIWVARALHQAERASWATAIGDTVILCAMSTGVLVVVLAFVARYFTGVWRSAAREVEAEASTAAEDTLLRRSDGRQAP